MKMMTAVKEVVSVVLLALAIVCMVIAAVVVAYADPGCMTKAEARSKWPRSHLYWHGKDRCWDNRKGGGRRYAARAEVKPEAENKKKKTDPPPAKRPTIIYPATRASTDDVYVPDWFNAFASTTWPQLIDIDDEPDPNNGKDGCCWPRLGDLLKDAWGKR